MTGFLVFVFSFVGFYIHFLFFGEGFLGWVAGDLYGCLEEDQEEDYGGEGFAPGNPVAPPMVDLGAFGVGGFIDHFCGLAVFPVAENIIGVDLESVFADGEGSNWNGLAGAVCF